VPRGLVFRHRGAGGSTPPAVGVLLAHALALTGQSIRAEEKLQRAAAQASNLGPLAEKSTPTAANCGYVAAGLQPHRTDHTADALATALEKQSVGAPRTTSSLADVTSAESVGGQGPLLARRHEARRTEKETQWSR